MGKDYIIFLAGGSGKRMQSEIPKQFIPIADKPILMWAMEAFEKYDPDLVKIIAIPENSISLWENLCKQFNFSIKHKKTAGGSTRFRSVKNALKLVDGDGLTGIHDGVRPFPSPETIRRVYQSAREYRAAIPYTDSTDTLREINGSQSYILDRNKIKRIQTPQVFHTSLIKEAYKQSEKPGFTDDASVAESIGEEIYLTRGNEENIKITQKSDLRIATLLAEAYFAK